MRTKASHWSPPNQLGALHLLLIVSLDWRQLLICSFGFPFEVSAATLKIVLVIVFDFLLLLLLVLIDVVQLHLSLHDYQLLLDTTTKSSKSAPPQSPFSTLLHLLRLENISGNVGWVVQERFNFSLPSPQKSPTDSTTLLQVSTSPQSLSHQTQLSTQISMFISRWQLQYRDRYNTACRSSLQHSSWHSLIGEGGLGPRSLKIWNVFRCGYFWLLYSYYNFLGCFSLKLLSRNRKVPPSMCVGRVTSW